MKKIEPVNLKKDTDSPSLHKGILFQYLITLDKWLDIYESKDSKTNVFCEREDDIFIINNSNKNYTFVQVKCYTEKFSFNSIEIKKTLYNFFLLNMKYAKRKCVFIFETNTNPKPRAGKILLEWSKKKSITKEIHENTQELLEKYINNDIKLKQDKKSLLIKYLKSKKFKEFISKIKWVFLNKSQEDAIKYYEYILANYPNSEYEKDAKARILYIKKMQEDKEKYVADFYFKTKDYDAAVFRYKNIFGRGDDKIFI